MLQHFVGIICSPATTYGVRMKDFAQMEIKGNNVTFQVDCGSTVNVLPLETYKQATNDNQLEHLKPKSVTLLMFNKSELKPVGQTKIQVKNAKNDRKYKLKFIIVAGQYR